MSKELLLKSAAAIQQPSEEASKEFREKVNLLIDKMNVTMLARPDVEDLVGPGNTEMMKDNHANHARFMDSVFQNYIPEVLVDTVMWVFRAYRSRNFSSTYWSAQLNTWMKIYNEELSEECQKEILPFYHWMQVNIPLFNQLAEGEFDAPLSSH